MPKRRATKSSTRTTQKAKRGKTAAGAKGKSSDREVLDVTPKESIESKLNVIFEKYADPEDTEVISLEGLGQICEEISIDAEADVRALVMCWKLGAKSKPQEITRTEFTTGMKDLRASSIRDLAAMAPAFDPGFMDTTIFREFYRYCFQFNREGTHKTLEKDLIISLLPMVIGNRSSFVDLFLEFLPQSKGTTRITADQWNSFLEFSLTVDGDFTGYDEDAAWPLLLDEFVDWCRSKKKESA